MTCACVESGKKLSNGLRMFPVLSYSRNLTHSGLSIVRCSSGIAPSRVNVWTLSALRASNCGDPGVSLASAVKVALPAMLVAGLPSGLCTSEFENSSTVRGVMMPW